MSRSIVNIDGNIYRFQCPHCKKEIEVLKNQLNCKIFRCGIFKNNFHPIPPHSKKFECDRLVRENLIYGCAKPFRFIFNNNGNHYVEICDYI